MANDLMRIVAGTESSLASRPSQYFTQLELFINADEKILSEFLIREVNEKPHHLRNKDWSALVGKPEQYSRPKIYLEEQRKKFPESERLLRSVIANGKFLEMGVSPETIAIFGDLPTMGYKMFDMETRLYESIVAYAKQIAEERGIKPIEVTRSSEGRDEIYLRTFKTREQFEWYHNTAAQMAITVLGAVYSTLESIEPKVKEMESIPLIGWILKRKLDKAFKPFPPKAIAESFLRDEINYNARLAERIYGNNKRVPLQIIEGELVQ